MVTHTAHYYHHHRVVTQRTNGGKIMSESDKKSLVEKMNEFMKYKRIELSEKSLDELENLQLETKEQYLEITIYEIRKVKWLYEHIQKI